MSKQEEAGLQTVGVKLEMIPAYLNSQSAMPLSLDMTDLYRWEHKVEDIAIINAINGPLYMKEFLKAKELSSSYYSKLILDYERAKNETKKQYALAYLERSQDYIKARGLKDTDETKKQYVSIDNGYQQAKDTEDMLKALVTLMGNKVDKFQNAYEATKNIYNNSREAQGPRSALPSYRDEA